MNLVNKLEYLEKQFDADKAFYTAKNTMKTGFKTIDSNMNLRRGVYLIGGLPSIGKTSFALQLADNFAKNGNQVLFFSLEQPEYDLTAKSLNRIKAERDTDARNAMLAYKKYAGNLATVTSESFVTIEDIESTIDQYIKEHNAKPIVMIDYLQLIRTTDNMVKKDSVSYISNKLVGISKSHKLTLFVLSALNRANYLSPIDFESFKESGSLEYDADVVFGLQYQLIENDSFMNCASVDKKRKMLSDEKEKDLRKVELVCLKNRFGKIIPKCKIDYHTSLDWFVEEKSDDVKPKRKATCF